MVSSEDMVCVTPALDQHSLTNTSLTTITLHFDGVTHDVMQPLVVYGNPTVKEFVPRIRDYHQVDRQTISIEVNICQDGGTVIQ